MLLAATLGRDDATRRRTARLLMRSHDGIQEYSIAFYMP